MRLLWIATKLPWPPRDGGRLLQKLTLEALAAEGTEITVVAPAGSTDPETAEVPLGGVRLERVPAEPRFSHPLVTALRSLGTGRPWTVATHDRRSMRARVAALLAEPGGFDAVHVEQIQAWPQASPARERGLPTVLRAQNVESDLWRGAARLPSTPWPLRAGFRWEGRRLARWEGKAVRRADGVLALTDPDAARLSTLAGGREVESLAAPFPEHLPAGEGSLAGEPPLVIFGSGGWLPNRDALRWFVQEVWPEVHRNVPGARLHVFGGEPAEGFADAGIQGHPAPHDSRGAFVPGSLMLVPLRIASGVRMKILEAWARGVPVLATPDAAAGLDVEDGRELLLFRDAPSLTHTLLRLRREPQLTGRLIRQARERLRHRHDPGRVARELLQIYRRVSEGRAYGYIR